MTIHTSPVRRSMTEAADAPEGPSAPFYLDGALIEAEKSGGAALRCEVARTPAALRALEEDWRALEALCARDIHAFQTYAWCAAWARTYLEDGGKGEPFVMTVRRAGEPVLLWPLMRVRLGPLRVLSWLSDPYCQYGDVLTALSGPALEEALEEAWRVILEEGAADMVRLRHVRADALIAPFLARRFRTPEEDEGAPWMDLTRFADEAAYEARYTKGQRRRRRRIRKALEEALSAPVAFSLVPPGEATNEAIGALVAEKRAWLARKGLYSRPLGSPELGRFLRALAAEGASAGGGPRVVVSQMQAGRKRISWELGFRFMGRHYAYITAHDREMTDLSPGRLHMDLAQRRALRDGMKVFDLLVPAAAHKKTWSSAVMPVRDYYRAISPAGRIVGDGYLNFARPLMRRAYRKTPEKLRRGLGLSRLGGGAMQE